MRRTMSYDVVLAWRISTISPAMKRKYRWWFTSGIHILRIFVFAAFDIKLIWMNSSIKIVIITISHLGFLYTSKYNQRNANSWGISNDNASIWNSILSLGHGEIQDAVVEYRAQGIALLHASFYLERVAFIRNNKSQAKLFTQLVNCLCVDVLFNWIQWFGNLSTSWPYIRISLTIINNI